MVALGKVQARGQVTVPSEIRHAVGIEPGDTLLLRATGPTTVEVEVLPRMTFQEFLDRYHVDAPYDDAAIREARQEDAAREIFGSVDE